MQENVTSCEALRIEESLERLEEQTKSDEQVCVEPYSRKTVSFGDTITLQAILCILLVLGFIAANILNGGLAADIFELYESKLNSDSTVVDVFAAIVDFLGTAPIDNV